MASGDVNRKLDSFQNAGSAGLSGLQGLNSNFTGINNAADARAKYGITDVGTTFDPLFKTLAANKSRRMQGSVTRAGRSATPEMTFSNIEGDYENSLQNLLGNKGMAQQQQEKDIAGLTQNAFSGADQFGLNKNNSIINGANTMLSGELGRNEQDWKEEQSKAKWYDVLGSIVGAGAKAAGAGATGGASQAFDWAGFMKAMQGGGGTTQPGGNGGNSAHLGR